MKYRCLHATVAILAVLAGRGFADAGKRDNAPALHSPPQPMPTCTTGLYVNVSPGDYTLPDLLSNLHRQTGYLFTAKGGAQQRTIMMDARADGSSRVAMNSLLHSLVRNNTGLTVVRHNDGVEVWEEAERKLYLAEQAASNENTSDRQLPGNERNTGE